MPAVNRKQRRMIAIAEHGPKKLFDRNKGVLSMSNDQMSDFSSTEEKGLPGKVGPQARFERRRMKQGARKF